MKSSIRLSLITATIIGFTGCGGGGSTGPSNITPVATNDTLVTVKNTTLTYNLQGNDYDSDGSITGQTIITQPTNGTLTSNANGDVTYIPNTGYVGTDSFTYTVTDNQNATSNITTVQVIINEGLTTDACSELSTGLYAYEQWRHPSSVSADDAYVESSEVKEIKLDTTNELHWKSDYYSLPGVSIVNWDSRGTNIANTGDPFYVIDMTNLTRTQIPHPIFPSTKTSCTNNKASFSNANGLITWEMDLSYTDISGDFILDHYANFEREMNDDINNKTKIFPSGSRLLIGNIIFTSNTYSMGTDSKSMVTDNNNLSLANIDFNNITGKIFKFDGGQTMTFNSATTFTFTDQNNANPISGTWQVLGTPPNQYIDTVGSARDNDDNDLFFAVIAGELRFGEKGTAGKVIPFGTTSTDIMDDIMFNKTASDAILFEISNADTDNDGTINSLDNDIDGDGILNANDAFPLNSTETIDTDNDGIGNNADTDDDGDGVLDSNDDFPLDNTETTDTDNDGIGNNADTDDDGDGVNDNIDNFPLDPNQQ